MRELMEISNFRRSVGSVSLLNDGKTISSDTIINLKGLG